MRDFKIFYDRDMDAAITTVKPHFNTIAEVLCFSANYAYCLGKKKKIGNDKVEVASGAVEKNAEYVYAIALQDTKDPKILEDSNECCRIFEMYANAGMHEIHKKLQKNLDRDPEGIKTLLELILKQRNSLKDIDDEEEEIVLP